MTRFIVTVESRLSSEALFDYLADMRNAPEWDPGVSTALLRGDPDLGLRRGSQFLVTLLLGGSSRLVTYELIEYHRPSRLVLRATQPAFTSTDVVSVETTDGGGSSASYEANLTLHGIARLGAPLATAAFRRIGRRAAAGLQRELGT
jgi:hypothetical protein